MNLSIFFLKVFLPVFVVFISMAIGVLIGVGIVSVALRNRRNHG